MRTASSLKTYSLRNQWPDATAVGYVFHLRQPTHSFNVVKLPVVVNWWIQRLRIQ